MQDTTKPASSVDELPDSMVIKLRKRVTLGKDELIQFDELTIREPTAGHLEKATGGTNIANRIRLIADSAQVLPAVVEQLCQRDFAECSEFLDQFSQDFKGEELAPLAEDEFTLSLARPIPIKGKDDPQPVVELKLVEPNAKQLAMSAEVPTGIGSMITLISQVAGVPRNVVERISERDLRRCAAFLARFSSAFPTTGEKDSTQ